MCLGCSWSGSQMPSQTPTVASLSTWLLLAQPTEVPPAPRPQGWPPSWPALQAGSEWGSPGACCLCPQANKRTHLWNHLETAFHLCGP